MEHARQEIPRSNTNRRYSMAGAISVPVNNDRKSKYTYSADEYPTIIIDKLIMFSVSSCVGFYAQVLDARALGSVVCQLVVTVGEPFTTPTHSWCSQSADMDEKIVRAS